MTAKLPPHLVLTSFLLLVSLTSLSLAQYYDEKSPTQIEKYNRERMKSYKIDGPNGDTITILEAEPDIAEDWVDVSIDPQIIERKNSNITLENTNIAGRCFGPSCHESKYDDEAQNMSPDKFEEFLYHYAEKLQNMKGLTKNKLQAMHALASKLSKVTTEKTDFVEQPQNYEMDINHDIEGVDKSYHTFWNKLKVKQHKHPYDDKQGWVTMEAIPWSTSKISKWKPNKNIKVRPWNDDRYNYNNGDKFSTSSDDSENDYYNKRPSFVNNRPSFTESWTSEKPSKPSWAKPYSGSNYPQNEFQSHYKPSCDSENDRYNIKDNVYYGMSDSVITDNKPTRFPVSPYEYEYQALSKPKPAEVFYSDLTEHQHPPSHPSSGDGQWVLLSTTRGYHAPKKRQRSMNFDPSSTVTSHQAIQLTVLPPENKENMTTSHGGILEVQRSFKTVDQTKVDMDLKNNSIKIRPKIAKGLIKSSTPDSSAVLAAVGAGMLPATMAMVVPMMLGKKRKRRQVFLDSDYMEKNIYHRYI